MQHDKTLFQAKGLCQTQALEKTLVGTDLLVGAKVMFYQVYGGARALSGEAL